MRSGPCVIVALASVVAACTPQRGSTPDPALRDLVSQARKLDLAGEQGAAIALYRQVLQRDPNAYDAHYGLARALDLAGAYDEARRHFSRAIELAPEGDKEQTLRMMGISWTFVGHLNEADRYFQQVFDRRLAEKNFASAAEEANELGRVHLELGDLDGAEKWYRTGHEVAGRSASRLAWQIDLADIRWAHAQARVAARRGGADEARRQTVLVKRLLDKGGNDGERAAYAYLIGYVDFYLGDYPAALSELTAADEQDPAVLVLMGQASENLGRLDQAREYYRKVIQSSSHAVNSAFARPIARRKVDAPR